MGVKLGPLLRDFGEEIGIEYFEGKRLAIDSYPVLYQVLATVRDQKGQPLRDSSGRITSHLVGLFNRSAKMLSMGIRPIFIFDGTPHQLKKKEVAKRKEKREKAEEKYQKALKAGKIAKAKKFAQQAIQVDEVTEKSAKNLLELMGIPVIEAPHDAEAQASYLVKKKECFAVASPDYDSFLFKSSKVVRNLRMTGTKPRLFKLSKLFDGLGITYSQLIDIALLLGTDFNRGGVKGIGKKTVLERVKKTGGIEKILSKKKFTWDPAYPSVGRIKEYFRNPPLKENVEIKFKEIDRDGIIEFLVEEREFSKERVISRLKEIAERKQKEKKRGIQSSLEQFTQ